MTLCNVRWALERSAEWTMAIMMRQKVLLLIVMERLLVRKTCATRITSECVGLERLGRTKAKVNERRFHRAGSIVCRAVDGGRRLFWVFVPTP